MIPYGKQTIDEDDIETVLATLKSSNLTQGEQVPAFESAVAKYVHSKYAMATSSATAALHLSCLSLGLNDKDIGWTTPLTFTASANAIRYCGANVDFVDIDITTGCISISCLTEKLKIAALKKTLPKVLIVVHYSGISCDMEAIHNACQPYGVKIIEDASHAIGGTYQNKTIGCCQYSELTIFSFHPVKIITSGEGGMITTNSKELSKKIKLLSSHGITKDPLSMNKSFAEPWHYEQHELGFNYRMSDIHASLGLSQLKKLPLFIEKRQQQAEIYKKTLKDLPLTLLSVPENCSSPWHIFVIQLRKESQLSRVELYHGLKEKGIGCQVHYIPVHTHPYYQELGFNWGNFPQAELFYQHCLTIPLYPSLAEQQNIIIENLQLLLK